MEPFREKMPVRRLNRKECKHYSSYHDTLREDFNQRCGYCDDNDLYRIRSFTIDHFIPQNPDGFTHDVKSNYYYNLVYSCRYCNSSKTNKWPSKDANNSICDDGQKGFIDPVDKNYSDLFERSSDGKIILTDSSNHLAKYIHNELKLWLTIHERMWKLEKTKKLNELIKEKLKEITDPKLKAAMEHLQYKALLILEEIQSNIFVQNNY